MDRRIDRRALIGAGAATAAALTLPRRTAAADGSGAYIDVPAYAQQRNLSCEYACCTIASAAFGGWVSEYEFDERVGWSANPHWGFRGDINGLWGGTDDYGVYPEPLVAPLAEFGFHGEVIYAGGNPWTLRARLDSGLPVIVWLGLWGDQSFVEVAADGSPFRLVPGYHVVVLHGYDEWGVSISDPGPGVYDSWDWDTFMHRWNVLDGMALAVSPF
jgi:uncharacterized protein YvpB